MTKSRSKKNQVLRTTTFIKDKLIILDRGKVSADFALSNQAFTRANFTKINTLGMADIFTTIMTYMRGSGTRA